MLNYLRSLFSRQPRGKLQPPRPWPAPPEASCFVKGLIASMSLTPESWEEARYDNGQSWIHDSTHYRIWVNKADEVATFNEPPFTPHERVMLRAAIDEVVSYRNRLAETRRLNRVAQIESHFKALGCPSVQP